MPQPPHVCGAHLHIVCGNDFQYVFIIKTRVGILIRAERHRLWVALNGRNVGALMINNH